MHKQILISALLYAAMAVSHQENAYVIRHVANDHICSDVIRFVKINDKGELILGGLHISHDNKPRYAEHLEVARYPKYTKMHWKNFAKKDPELAQDLMQDPYLAAEITRSSNTYIRVHWGSKFTLQHYLNSGYCFGPHQEVNDNKYSYLYSMPRISPEHNSETKKLLVHKDALSSLRGRFMTSLRETYKRELKIREERINETDKHLDQLKMIRENPSSVPWYQGLSEKQLEEYSARYKTVKKEQSEARQRLHIEYQNWLKEQA